MALRGLWLVRLQPGAAAALLFSRRYPTVEKRAKTFNGASYVTLPEDSVFLKALLFELRLMDEDKSFVDHRDSCSRINKTSVYALPVGGGDLWPVLAFQKSGLLYVCLPLVEQSLKPRPPLINISGISQAFAVLSGLLVFINSSQKNEAEINAKCDLEGAASNVTISVNLPANGSPLQDILVHPCVTSLDSAILTASSVDGMDDSAFSGPYKFPFTPPSDVFDLCYYTSQVPVPPILGFYQMKEEESQLKLTINLKLHESVKNAFEYCEARIPFFNRGPITHLEYKVSYGQLDLSREKSLLVWVIGQKFPKSLEISLSGTVTFGSINKEHSVDPICTGNTAYIKLYFRIPDYTVTGCYTDQHSVQVFSSGKPKINTSRELISSDYYIWNSKAPAPVVYRTLFF
ncbi:AP-5 complex subunit mu-1 isoform X3 [Alligator mississippiensis]|uniref:AP-5 complex subunit mu-1 isoform X3 n=1 Tax=Alligator mississippiensis TaxID=8496 RepID=UPI002877C167|nr:AP-5 complex subunit mu-1 isoform X3 [Alligator mississippiensis]